MANAINRLTTRQVQAIKEPGRHADGGGLYLVVDKAGSKRWVMLYRMGVGVRREMGLGAVISVSLARARELAAEARAKIASGIDPVQAKKARELPRASPVTFADVATVFMADREESWRNAKHRAQWRMTLEVHAAKLWNMPVADVATDDVLAVLRPLWHQRAETARRIRGRIENILDSARAHGHRAGENPARWKGHLDAILPRSVKLQRGHHAAMPYNLISVCYEQLGNVGTPAAVALQLLILTAARSGEIRGMPWGEISFDDALWTIPEWRMKAGRIHRVPLTEQGLALLRSVRPDSPKAADLVFPSRSGKPYSDMTFAMALRRLGYPDVTAHGFRSTFRDWVGNETDFRPDLAEAALAHLVGDETERAYRRGDALAKRRHLMEAWARFVASESGAPLSTRSNSE